MSLTDLAAGVPEPIAIPRSASLRASVSLTPSPVMATTSLRRWRACNSVRFASGVTRPNTAVASASSASASGSSGSSRASTYRSAPGTLHRRAIAATVTGLSPEITFGRTFSRRKYSTVSAASGRTSSLNRTSAAAAMSSGTERPSGKELAWARSSTRRPSSARVATRSTS